MAVTSRTSQTVAEAVSSLGASGKGRVSQTVSEALAGLSLGGGRVSQTVAEVLCLTYNFNSQIPIFPPNPTGFLFRNIPARGWTQKWRPNFATIENVAISGRSVRIPQQQLAFHEFELTFEVMRDQTQNQVPYANTLGFQEMNAISELFLYCNGSANSFYYTRDDDNSRLAQQIGTGNGNTALYTAVRTWGFGALQFVEPVGAINVLQNVYLNGVVQSGATYSVVNGNQIKFTSTVPNGVVITIDFTFYYLCRFLEDMHDYEEFYKNLWQMKQCKFRSLIDSTS